MNCSINNCDRKAKKRGWCDRHYQRWLNHGHPEALKRAVLQGTPEERFWPRVNKTDTCWLWTAGTDGVGYGKFNDGSKITRAHQFSYAVAHGWIPEGMDLDHICHVTLCVRPSHLRAVTVKQNLENLLDSRKNSTTGYRGVSLIVATGKYRAYVNHQRKQYHVGVYDTPGEAAEAARQKRLLLFTHSDMDKEPRNASNAIRGVAGRLDVRRPRSDRTPCRDSNVHHGRGFASSPGTTAAP